MNQYSPPYPYGPSVPPYHLDAYRKPLRRYSNIIGGGLLILQLISILLYLLLDGIFSFVDYGAIPFGMADLLEESLSLVNTCVSFWLATLFIFVLVGMPGKAAFPMRRPRASILVPAIFVTLGASIVGAFLSGTLSTFLEWLTGFAPYMPDMPAPYGAGANVVYILNMALVPAVFEELLFRGVILQSLRRFGDGFALGASAILFGLMHGNLMQAPNAILMGVVIGYFVLRTGSLVTGVILHFVNNGLVVVLGYIAPMLSMEQADLLYMSMYGAYLLLGAAALVFLIVRQGNMFRVPPGDCPLSTRQKYLHLFTTAAMIVFVLGAALLTVYYFE